MEDRQPRVNTNKAKVAEEKHVENTRKGRKGNVPASQHTPRKKDNLMNRGVREAGAFIDRIRHENIQDYSREKLESRMRDLIEIFPKYFEEKREHIQYYMVEEELIKALYEMLKAYELLAERDKDGSWSMNWSDVETKFKNWIKLVKRRNSNRRHLTEEETKDFLGYLKTINRGTTQQVLKTAEDVFNKAKEKLSGTEKMDLEEYRAALPRTDPVVESRLKSGEKKELNTLILDVAKTLKNRDHIRLMDLSRINKTITDLEKETKAVEERKAEWEAERKRNEEERKRRQEELAGLKRGEEPVAQLHEEVVQGKKVKVKVDLAGAVATDPYGLTGVKKRGSDANTLD